MRKVIYLFPFLFLSVFFSGAQQLNGWAVNMGDVEDDCINDIAIDGAGNSYVCGTFELGIFFYSSINPPVFFNAQNGNTVDGWMANSFIAKYSASGNLIWSKQLIGEVGDTWNGLLSIGARKITIDEKANVYVLGSFGDTASIDGIPIYGKDANETFLIKLDSSGNVKFAKTISSNNDACESRDISYNHFGKIIFTGCGSDSLAMADTTLYLPNSNFITYILVLDTLGNFHECNILDSGKVWSLSNALNGDLFFCGEYWGNVYWHNNLILPADTVLNFFYLSLDSADNLKWSKVNRNINTNGILYGNFIEPDNNSNAYIIGNYYSDSLRLDTNLIVLNGLSGAFCAKVDSTGNFIWVQSIQGPSLCKYMGVFTSADNKVYLLGEYSDTIHFSNYPISFSRFGFNDFLASFDTAGNYLISTADQDFSASENLHGVGSPTGDRYIGGEIFWSSNFNLVPNNILQPVHERDGLLLNISQFNTSITETPNVGVSIYPNPAKDFMQINISDETINEYFVSIINSSGQEFQLNKLMGNLNIYGLNYCPGLYIIKLISKEKVLYKKLIIY